ncbi:16S rRNA (cytidine(1402)-2'-O)-methyltransferase [Limnohabitans sp. MMS-10A-160]|uniref:16S rRNA (cytidine(1402)-2'-O)-methyltransferase n=1 Tax=unclassified Limnohabitans TaxID=2626134 RepID=UPI000D376D82|nr:MULTISPECIES: 16S rRNA (cytidine(1402)-2'-O)-methyltransferase [unclassified Limnohabitans]PUE18988.1 16S rRNA (cytidine(1402)-2'-O)-methyltransferase [Limnohabitans sp. MMS-10A-192]PUE24407.1 16S rRNA (cytidine(1402)-2'-O)-methyltransferase [Limnohabitans sp. MMS-10A-160]
MSASFAPALAAANDAAGQQNHPVSTLYVVATPIGNLADISLRALHVLQKVDVIACEDTRHTQQMLRAYGIDRPGAQLLAVHQHNEAEAAQTVIARLAQGERVAYVSDAGTPAISDPGARLAAAVRQAGYRVLPLPGASSVITVLSASGMTGDGGFVFTGFLPSKAGERQHAVQALAQETRAVVLLEAPHRIEALAQALAVLGERRITVGRELTKQFEQIETVVAQDFAAWLAEKPDRQRGEFALVVHDAPVTQTSGEGLRVLQLLLPELPLKTAVKLTAEITGESKNALYEQALALKK